MASNLNAIREWYMVCMLDVGCPRTDENVVEGNGFGGENPWFPDMTS